MSSSPARKLHLVITCEHAGNRVPPEYRHLFEGAEDILETHRGYDIGGLSLATALGERFGLPVFSSPYTRLLVDLNRSLTSRSLFSSFSSCLPKRERRHIVEAYYEPYRREAEKYIAELAVKPGAVLHVSMHTFTPMLEGKERKADIAFLYDPRRNPERSIASDMAGCAREASPGLAIRRNYPYKGSSDSFTTFLRKKYSESVYYGIEIEVNQKHVFSLNWRHIADVLSGCIVRTVHKE